MKLTWQLAQGDDYVVMLGVVGIQVTDMELIEVADDDPTWPHRIR